MNDVQMQAMSLARHHRILERARAEESAAAKSPEAFGEALEAAAPAPAQPMAALVATAPAAEPQRILSTRPGPAITPQLSADQAALLAASLGATPPDEASPAPIMPAAATPAVPDMSDDQMAALMAAFGHDAAPAEVAARQYVPDNEALPQTAAAMAATAIPQSREDNLRYFPIRRDDATPNAAAQMAASDTYLRAMQQMEQNLGAYGGLAGNGR